jgi:hypothetical protein
MYGYGSFGRIGYDSPMDTNPFIPGTQLSPFDADPTRPGIQLPGAINGIPHYSSPYDTNPYLAGTQLGGGIGGCYGGGYGVGGYGLGGLGGTVTTTYTSYGTPGFF